jgi:hypothetical protein
MNDPTPEEVARVDAWRKAKQAAEWDSYKARTAEIEQAERQKLVDALVGRRIADVGGDQDHANWVNLVVTLDDGTVLKLEDVPYSDTREIDVEVKPPS